MLLSTSELHVEVHYFCLTLALFGECSGRELTRVSIHIYMEYIWIGCCIYGSAATWRFLQLSSQLRIPGLPCNRVIAKAPPTLVGAVNRPHRSVELTCTTLY
jgi:hypothetical protein